MCLLEPSVVNLLLQGPTFDKATSFDSSWIFLSFEPKSAELMLIYKM